MVSSLANLGIISLLDNISFKKLCNKELLIQKLTNPGLAIVTFLNSLCPDNLWLNFSAIAIGLLLSILLKRRQIFVLKSPFVSSFGFSTTKLS
jgi:hypothetical protein